MCLWEFSRKFENFLGIFHAFKIISRFSGIVFAFKIISENKNPNLSFRFGPSPWARPALTQPFRPSGGPLEPVRASSQAAGPASRPGTPPLSLARAPRPRLARAPMKAAARASCSLATAPTCLPSSVPSR
jgi:hypothetical protein